MELNSSYYNKKIDAFVEKYQGNVKQRSEEWLKLTKSTIGGSEIATILGENKYKTKYDLAREKVGIYPGFTGNFACWWGTVFEDIIARFIELDCMTIVKGAELTVQDIPSIRYSPDGYAVVKVHGSTDSPNKLTLITHENMLEHHDCPNCKYIIVLVEIKCPRSRKPVPGEVPMHYLPQLYSGLVFSPMAHLAMFTEAVIKKISLDKLPTKQYVSFGLIGVYSKKQKTLLDPNYYNNDIIDIGNVSQRDLEEYFRLICNDHYTIEYCDPILDQHYFDNNTLDTIIFDLKTRSGNLIGVIPWYMEEIHYTFVKRQPNFLQRIIDSVRDFNEIVNGLKEDRDYIEKRFQAFDEIMCDDLNYEHMNPDVFFKNIM